MAILLAVSTMVVGLILMYAALMLPLRIWNVRRFRRMPIGELRDLAFGYEDRYFSVIGHDHADVACYRAMVTQRDLASIRKNWRRLSRSFVKLERTAGHTGRPLILEYYCDYELVLSEYARKLQTGTSDVA